MYAKGRRLRTIFMLRNLSVISNQFVDMNYFFKNSCQQLLRYNKFRKIEKRTKEDMACSPLVE